MSLLHLEGIGKIYVSDGSVAVGIRHVTLDFDIGEFVAVTGKSGSGKTTLLNVISGMDTYEEGELYIEGEPTSHFSQGDWEAYREEYISFIFQDYNIIDSFTVLQNVELALSGIEDKRMRRKRALELIERVGLTAFRNHKGAKLSGGQKQRTVIARALAKDSPIILADEPTGNLDSKSSGEIIELLAEIAREKLVIVVTHSFAQVETHATREIRIFDGGVERDVTLREAPKKPLEKKQKQQGKAHTLRRAAELGRHRFFATPKLSVFLCLLMVIAMLGTFFATALCVADPEPVGEANMFTHINGRTVLVRQDGAPVTEAELKALAETVGARSYLRFDALLDHTTHLSYFDSKGRSSYFCTLAFTNDAALTPDVGRRPEAADEAFLILPIAFAPIFGKKEIVKDTVTLYGSVQLKVVGVSYYYDNTRPSGQVVLSDKGFELMSAADFLCGQSWQNDKAYSVDLAVTLPNGTVSDFRQASNSVVIDHTLKDRSISLQIYDKKLQSALENAIDCKARLSFGLTERDEFNDTQTVRKYTAEDVTLERDHVVPDYRDKLTSYELDYGDSISYAVSDAYYAGATYTLAISPQLAQELMLETRQESYSQGSLFFADDKAAQGAQAALREAGYLGVLSNATYVNADNLISAALQNLVMFFVWAMMVCFLAIFVALCSSRAMAAKKADLAILRSMGIPNRVVKLSGYVLTLLAVLPSLALLAVAATVCYLHPAINPEIPFLHAPQYILIVLGLVALSLLVTRWHNRRMFRDSVRKTMRGGEGK